MSSMEICDVFFMQEHGLSEALITNLDIIDSNFSHYEVYGFDDKSEVL